MENAPHLFDIARPQKKIAWIENAEFLGGAELFSLDMLCRMDCAKSDGLLVDVYSGEDTTAGFSEHLANGAKTLPSSFHVHHKGFHFPRLKPFSFGTLWDAVTAVRDIITRVKEERYDVVYCNTVRGALIVGIAQFFFPKTTKTVFMAHDYTFPAALVRFIVSRFDQVLACSYGVKQYLVENGLKSWKAEVIENGIEPESFADIAPITPPLFSVSVIGRISQWKGQLTVCKAAKWIRDNAPDYPFRFHFYGEPSPKTEDHEYLASIQSFLSEHDLSDMVTLHGFTPLKEALSDHHIVIHAAEEDEPFGRVPLEAAAAGKIICVSDKGTPAQIFEDKKNAFFFTAGNFESLAETLIIIAHNRDKSLEIAQRGKELVTEKFTLSVLAKRFWGYF